MSHLITDGSIPSQIQLLESLYDALQKQNREKISQVFESLTPFNQSMLNSLAPLRLQDKFQTRFRREKEQTAVKQLLTLLRDQSSSSSTQTHLSEERTGAVSPPPDLKRRKFVEGNSSSSSSSTSEAAAATFLPVPQPLTHSALLPDAAPLADRIIMKAAKFPIIFFQEAIFCLHPQDAGAFACTQRRNAQMIRSIRDSKSVMFHIKQAIIVDNADYLRMQLEKIPKSDRQRILNRVDITNIHLLTHCINHESLKCLDVLISEGLDIFFQTSCGKNALHRVAIQGNSGLLKLFLDKFALITTPTDIAKKFLLAKDIKGNTPLLYCAQSGNADCLNILLKFGANILDINKKSENLIHLSIKANHFSFVQSCLAHICGAIARELLNMSDFEGNNPLFYIFDSKNSESEKLEMLDILLQFGTNPIHLNSKVQNFAHRAVINLSPRLLEYFLSNLPVELRKRIANTRDHEGDTPVIVATMKGCISSLKLLIAAGGDLLTRNYQNMTLFSFCQKSTKLILRKFLLQHEPRLEGFYAMSLFMHAFDIEKNMKIGGMGGERLLYTGSNDYAMRDEMLTFLKTIGREKIVSCCSETQLEQLITAYENCVLDTDESLRKAFKRIQAGELVIIATGWEEHAVCLVFYNGYYVVCNLGEESLDKKGELRTFFASKIDVTSINLDHILQIDKNEDNSANKGALFLYETLPTSFKGTKDAFCTAMNIIAPPQSDAGVCTYASKMAALRASLMLLTGNMKLAKDLSMALAHLHRKQVLKYFRATPSPFSHSTCQKLISRANKMLSLEKLKISPSLT